MKHLNPRMSLFLLFPLLFSPSLSISAQAFETGFNQGWTSNHYGSQWGRDFDETEFARLMDLTKAANGSILRFWLFEGFQSDALLWKNGNVEGLSPNFVTNLRKVILQAKARGIKLNLTLFDGNIAKEKPPSKEHEYFWWNLFNEKYGVRENFLQNVWVPLLQVLSEPELEGGVTQIDLVNEINALTRKAHPLRFESGWAGANRFICAFKNIRDNLAPGKLPLTASVGWNNAADAILNGSLYAGCVDFFDLHVYDNNGEIPRCGELANYAHKRGKTVQLGEYGQSRQTYSDYIQKNATQSFLQNAEACGLDAALAWRLSEPDSSAYLTYEKNGVLRPAYEVIRKHKE